MPIDQDTLRAFVLAIHNRPPEPRDATPDGITALMAAGTERIAELRAAIDRRNTSSDPVTLARGEEEPLRP